MKIKKILFVCLALLFTFILVSCEVDGEAKVTTNEPSDSTTTANVINTPTPSGTTTGDPVVPEPILPSVEDAAKIEVGMTYEQVKNTLIGNDCSYSHYCLDYVTDQILHYCKWNLSNGQYVFVVFLDSSDHNYKKTTVESFSLHSETDILKKLDKIEIGMSHSEVCHILGECTCTKGIANRTGYYGEYAHNANPTRSYTFSVMLSDDEYLMIWIDIEKDEVTKLDIHKTNYLLTESDLEKFTLGMTVSEITELFGWCSDADNFVVKWNTTRGEPFVVIFDYWLLTETEDGLKYTNHDPDVAVFGAYESECLNLAEAEELIKQMEEGTITDKLQQIDKVIGYRGHTKGAVPCYYWYISGGSYLEVRRIGLNAYQGKIVEEY